MFVKDKYQQIAQFFTKISSAVKRHRLAAFVSAQ
jgi:hypothetical protein